MSACRKKPFEMTATECEARLASARRAPNCLPQDVEYWQYWIDFHNSGRDVAIAQKLAEARRPKPRYRVQANSFADLSQDTPSLPTTPAATPTDSANPPPVESVGPNSEAQ